MPDKFMCDPLMMVAEERQEDTDMPNELKTKLMIRKNSSGNIGKSRYPKWYKQSVSQGQLIMFRGR